MTISDERLVDDLSRYMADTIGHGLREKVEPFAKMAVEFLRTTADTEQDGKGVKVKGLEWTKWSDGTWRAPTLLGEYKVEKSGPHHWLPHPPALIQYGPLSYERMSEDEAKAAAEADYRQRILSTLSNAPQQEAGPNWAECCNMSPEGCDCTNPKHIHVNFSSASPPPVDPAPSQDGVVTDEMVEQIGASVFGRHERGWVMWPLVDEDAVKKCIALALNKGGE